MFGEYHESNQKYKVIRNIYTAEHTSSEKTISPAETLLEMNADYIGWIKVDNTEINYPVVHTDNNEFYLTHNFYKERDKAGAIFLDANNSREKLDKNMILYGHNMKDNSIFGSLNSFTNQNFFNNQGSILLDFQDRTYEWEVFSVYQSKDGKWMKNQFSPIKEFEKYISTIKERSLFPSSTEVTTDDYILTLSTCTNADEDERIIVHAKLTNVETDTKGEGEKNET